MKVVNDFPPNIAAIREAFPLSGYEIFAYGDTIFSPKSTFLAPELIVHEEVHREQQGDDVEGWWDRYLVDKDFRASQELEAHIAEWLNLKSRIKDRNERVKACAHVARKLAAPLYGKVFSYRNAMDHLRNQK